MNNRENQRFWMKCLAGLFVTIAVVIGLQGRNMLGSKGADPNTVVQRSGNVNGNNARESRRGNDRASPRKLDKRAQLAYIKSLWEAAEAARAGDAEREELTLQTVKTLRASPELLELAEWLRSRDIKLAGNNNLLAYLSPTILGGLEAGDFVSYVSIVSRSSLFGKSDIPAHALYGLAYEWGSQGGKDDVISLCNVLSQQNEAYVTIALMGQNEGLLRRKEGDPSQILLSSLQLLDVDHTLNVHLKSHLMSIPNNADFPSIEQALHANDRWRRLYPSSQLPLFELWFAKDRHDLMNYVAESRLTPTMCQMLGQVAVRHSSQDRLPLEEVVKLSEVLPHGEYRDAFLEAVASGNALDYPEIAIKFSEMISSEAGRERAYERISKAERVRASQGGY